MTEHDEGSTIEHVSVDECWTLFTRAEVGRLGVAAGGAVEIFPVNFVAVQKRIVFRTTSDRKRLDRILANPVAFEIDGWDDRRAWSVLVKGAAELMSIRSGTEEAARTGLDSWAPGPKNAFVQVQPSDVTGRRFARTAKAETVWYW